MKILFFIILLANIVFFLWEINSGGPKQPLVIDKALSESRQILLVSELPNKEQKLVEKELEKNTHKKEKSVSTNKKIAKKELGQATNGLIYDKPKEQSSLTFQNDKIDEKSERQSELIKPKLEDEEKIIDQTGDQPNKESNIEISKGDVITEQVNEEKNSKKSKDEAITEQVTNNSGKLTENKQIAKDKIEVKDQNNNPLSKPNSISKDKQESSQDSKQRKNKETKQNNKQMEIEKANAYCHQIGPFKDQTELENWVKNNKIIASNLKQINKPENTITGYLVYYPAEDTLEKSKKNIDILKQKGVTDFWLFENDELKGVISLGLFKTESRALKLKNVLDKKAVEAKIMERFANDAGYYAQLLSDNKKLNDNVQILEAHSVSKCKK